MSEIPEEIRCDFDTEKVCPVRAAAYAIGQLREAPEGEHPSPRECETVIDEAVATLSKSDLARVYAITDPSGQRQDIRPGTCRTGPARLIPFLGKESCGAATVNYVREAPVPPPTPAPEAAS